MIRRLRFRSRPVAGITTDGEPPRLPGRRPGGLVEQGQTVVVDRNLIFRTPEQVADLEAEWLRRFGRQD